MITVYVGVGTNVEQEKHAQAAWTELSQLGQNLQASPVYECAPVGFTGDSFYNFIIKLQTDLPLKEFAHQLREIEFRWGRSATAEKYQDRSLDLDIVLFGETISAQAPQVPRDDIFKYSFVIKPLYDLSPELIIPGDLRTVEQIWQAIDTPNSLHEVDINFK
ncbi:2-amino-4-hydroxy-6-hydroxymethyldihydropteridine diphosphokinase [Vibrio sp. 10N.286.49.B3]|uniref:2-amino-4-hydroxy-6- hydroxymethyldihydropteridine diphosphokinase n=1 Tax=Vibrio sp. 10N.286.49.B3 TaxID=1880855 RepID=UPI000C86105D|nr:2-amino-4-hydroxy-6-hydroxymethyldihydropteridine diphosphokinase [Vibrio sp. 10N.286.49.B3]PMH39825.1 2-amino-4-hydroxy-6-hydroxymethyldihydropteridine diphosphokinase [Vibrio sp. 10N.286.49.B3]